MHSLDTLVMESSNNAGELPCGIIGPSSQDRVRLIHLLDLCLKGSRVGVPGVLGSTLVIGGPDI